MKRIATTKINKKNVSTIWDNGIIKIKFSNPTIETSNEKKNIKSLEEVMYYMYDVDVYTKETEYLDDDKELTKWVKSFATRAYDFPGLPYLQGVLDELLKQKEPNDEYMTIKYKDGSESKSYTFRNDDFFCEDIYNITKTFHPDDYTLKVGYDLEFGTCKDGYNQIVKVINSEEDEIKKLKEVVDNFIKMSIEKYNEKMNKYYIEQSKNKYTVDNILVVNNDYDGPEFFLVGDIVEDFDYIKNDNLINMYRGQIIKIEKDYVTFQFKDEKIRLNVSEIFNIYDYDVDKTDRIRFNLKEIAKDFKENVLSNSPTILNEFEILDNKTLLEKYNNAIISRYWMCRDEHEYMKNIPDNIENVEYVTDLIYKEILPEIKRLFKEKDIDER